MTDKISSLPPVSEMMRESGLEPKKQFGQNFLFDLNLKTFLIVSFKGFLSFFSFASFSLFIASANSGAIDTTFILSIIFSNITFQTVNVFSITINTLRGPIWCDRDRFYIQKVEILVPIMHCCILSAAAVYIEKTVHLSRLRYPKEVFSFFPKGTRR